MTRKSNLFHVRKIELRGGGQGGAPRLYVGSVGSNAIKQCLLNQESILSFWEINGAFFSRYAWIQHRKNYCWFVRHAEIDLFLCRLDQPFVKIRTVQNSRYIGGGGGLCAAISTPFRSIAGRGQRFSNSRRQEYTYLWAWCGT